MRSNDVNGNCGSLISRRRFLGSAAALAGAAAIPEILAACGTSSTASQRPSSGSLLVATYGDMQNLDPYTTSSDDITDEMLANLYALPTTFKVPGPSIDGVPAANPDVFMPQAAYSWSWNADQTELTFAFRPGITFPDGTPLDANAVKASWDRSFDLKATGYFLFAMVGITDKSQVVVVDPTHLKLVMPQPSSLLMGNLNQFYSTAIINMKQLQPHTSASDPQGETWLKTNVAGSGPYVLESWNHGSSWTLKANPRYWSPPRTRSITFQIVPDVQERELLVESGKVDIARGIPVKDVPALRAQKDLTVIAVPSRYTVFAGMNVSMKPFDNKLLRQAFSYAVPYDTIMKEVMHGLGVQLKGPIPQGMPTSDFSFWHYDTDYARARALLAQAGYPNGLSTQLSVIDGVDTDEETAIWIQQGLQKIGVQVTINKMPASAYNAQLQARSLPFFINSEWVSINNDPFYQLFWLFSADCCTYARYQNPSIMSIINQWIDKPASDPGRIAASKRAQQIIVDDAPWIFLYQPPDIYVQRSNVKGFVYEPADSFIRYERLYKV